MIDRLCEQRLVERRPHPSDRRANRLYLTPKGRATLERLAPLSRELLGQALAGFDEAQARHLLQQLLHIKNNIRAAAETEAGHRAANGGRHVG
jgi:MarR family transcriptional regulator for hemolysin